MSQILSQLLDLELSWKRVKLDYSEGRSFLEFPNEFRLFEENIDECIAELASELKDGTYSPKPSLIIEVPKPGGSTRPAAYLELWDRIVYYALVGACYGHIYQFISKELGDIDIAYPIFSDSQTVKWIWPGFKAWTKFRNKSLEIIDDYASWVVIADISACF